MREEGALRCGRLRSGVRFAPRRGGSPWQAHQKPIKRPDAAAVGLWLPTRREEPGLVSSGACLRVVPGLLIGWLSLSAHGQ